MNLRPVGATEDTETFAQKEAMGDVLISVTGLRCTVEQVTGLTCSCQTIWKVGNG